MIGQRLEPANAVLASATALLLVGSFLTLVALFGLAALVGLAGLLLAPEIGLEAPADLTLPPPPPAAPRDPWTPLSAGLRHLTTSRHGSHAKTLARIYRERSFRPFWVTPHSLSEGGQSLVLQLSSSDDAGFPPDEHRLTEIGHLHQLAFPQNRPPDAHAIAELEWELSNAFAIYATELMGGKAPWARAQADWHLSERSPDVRRIFQKLGEWGASRTIQSLLRSHERYTSLRQALSEYRSIERAGGWSRIEASGTLGPGDRSARVVELRRRLAVTADLGKAGDSPVYDAEVERAVHKFQERHGLSPNGRVGPETLEAMNVPVEYRIRQLEINLERRRWLPARLGEEFLWVNIPEFRLRAYRKEREVLSMPVVVGAPSSPTPAFQEELAYAVLNPYWYVPESIAMNELVPKAHRDPDFLMRANYELLDEGGSLVASERLRTDLLRSGLHRLRRKPGPQNDLGRIKFMMPNPFKVYLHDTPARYLFERTSRAFSHGCVRVGQPLELAKHLFPGRFAQIEGDLEAGEHKVVRLEKPVPVYIVYFTAWRSGDGAVHFRKDIYGRDEALWPDLAFERPSKPNLPWPRLD